MVYLTQHLFIASIGLVVIALVAALMRLVSRRDSVVQYRVQSVILVLAAILLPAQIVFCQLFTNANQRFVSHPEIVDQPDTNVTPTQISFPSDTGVDPQMSVLPNAELLRPSRSPVGSRTNIFEPIFRSSWMIRAMKFISAIYLLGVLVGGFVLLLRLAKTLTFIRNSELVQNVALQTLVGDLIGPQTLLYVSDEITTPCCLVFPRQMVVFPRDQIRRLSADQLTCVLQHESVHISRRDWVVCWFERLLCVSMWFHPGSYFIARRLAALREQSCDAIVVRKTQLAKTYANTLLACCQTGRQPTLLLTNGFNSAETLKRRLEMLTFANLPASRIQKFFTWTMVAIFATLFSCGQAAVLWASPPQQESKQQSGVELKVHAKSAQKSGASKRLLSVEIQSIPIGKNALESLQYLQRMTSVRGIPISLGAGQETVLYAKNGRTDGTHVVADEFLLNLPEGSKLKAIVDAENMSIKPRKTDTQLVLTNGQIKIVGHDGTVRFKLRTKAKRLVVSTYESSDEVILRVTSADKQPRKLFVEMDLATITPKETVTPFRTTQFALQRNKLGSNEPVRVKMKTEYDMRLLKKAAKQVEANASSKSK